MHEPLDLAIILPGTEDLKIRFLASAYDTHRGSGVPVDVVQKSVTGPGDGVTQVLLSPRRQ